jgi:hypothetical protein
MIAMLVGAISSAIGAAIGYLLFSIWKSTRTRNVGAFIGALLAFNLGRVFVTPWVQVEYLFLNPPPELQALIDLAPDGAMDLKSRFLELYRSGGTEVEAQRIGFEWGHKYQESVNLTSLFALEGAFVKRCVNKI